MIVKVSGGYKIKSHKTGKMYPKVYGSREAAQERINQMEKFKHMKKSDTIFVVLEKAKPYTRTKKGKLERVKGYSGRAGLPEWSQGAIIDKMKNIVKDFTTEDQLARYLNQYNYGYNLPTNNPIADAVFTWWKEKNAATPPGIPAQSKKTDPIPVKKLQPGDGIKPIDEYRTVWDLGKAIGEELERISRPPGFGGFAVGFSPNNKAMVISWDEPRELRHPEDYRMPEYETSNARNNYRKLSEAIDKVVKKLEDQGVRVIEAFDSSDVKNWIVGRPRESEYVV